MTKSKLLVGAVILGATTSATQASPAEAATAAATPTWVTTQGKVVHLTKRLS